MHKDLIYKKMFGDAPVHRCFDMMSGHEHLLRSQLLVISPSMKH